MSRQSVSIVIGLLASVVIAVVAYAQDAAELTRTFDAYNAAAKAGNVEKMLSLFTAKQRKDIRKEIVKKEERDYFLLIWQAQIPESYEVQHVTWAKNRQGATLYLLVQLPAMPVLERPRMRMEEAIFFKKENSKWKIDSILPIGDPDNIKRPKDLTYDPDDANLESRGAISGRIIKTEFKPDYTLVILRVMDEECAIFLPAKEVLEKAGVPLDEFSPWNIHEFQGYPHKSDKLKFFATEGRLIEED